jgi:hypothetical protein
MGVGVWLYYTGEGLQNLGLSLVQAYVLLAGRGFYIVPHLWDTEHFIQSYSPGMFCRAEFCLEMRGILVVIPHTQPCLLYNVTHLWKEIKKIERETPLYNCLNY